MKKQRSAILNHHFIPISFVCRYFTPAILIIKFNILFFFITGSSWNIFHFLPAIFPQGIIFMQSKNCKPWPFLELVNISWYHPLQACFIRNEILLLLSIKVHCKLLIHGYFVCLKTYETRYLLALHFPPLILHQTITPFGKLNSIFPN